MQPIACCYRILSPPRHCKANQGWAVFIQKKAPSPKLPRITAELQLAFFLNNTLTVFFRILLRNKIVFRNLSRISHIHGEIAAILRQRNVNAAVNYGGWELLERSWLRWSHTNATKDKVRRALLESMPNFFPAA